jgi:hypothetical protein
VFDFPEGKVETESAADVFGEIAGGGAVGGGDLGILGGVAGLDVDDSVPVGFWSEVFAQVLSASLGGAEVFFVLG